MEALASVIAAIAVVVVLFLTFRAFVLCYWKIDEQISVLKESATAFVHRARAALRS